MNGVRWMLLLCMLSFMPSAHAHLPAAGPAPTCEEFVALSDQLRMPAGFENFSLCQVFSTIFPTFDPVNGEVTVRTRRGGEQTYHIHMAHVAPWPAQGQNHLVVAFYIEGWPEVFEEGYLCQECRAFLRLAVLKRQGEALERVATSSGDLEKYGSIPHMGRDRIDWDLTTQQLRDGEGLVAITRETRWIPDGIWRTVLLFYRVEQGILVKVFETVLEDRQYLDGVAGSRIERHHATVVLEEGESEYHDLRLSRSIYECEDQNGDKECGSGEESKPPVVLEELWQFNGKVFMKVE